MFEVGKRYTPIGEGRTASVIEVLFVTDNTAMIRIIEHEIHSIVGSEHAYHKSVFSHWKEVKEPRKAEAWVNVYKNLGGALYIGGLVYTNEKECKRSQLAKCYVDTIKIEYTETL